MVTENKLDKLINTIAQVIDPDMIPDRRHPFGGLRPVDEPSVSRVYSETCYICNDPEFAQYGLPLCYPCVFCGGHIAADDSRCDKCKQDTHGIIRDSNGDLVSWDGEPIIDG